MLSDVGRKALQLPQVERRCMGLALVEAGIPHSLQMNPVPEGVAVYRIHGPFLFGAADKLDVIERELETLPPVVVLRLRNMTAIDATGVHALERLADRLHATGRQLLICGLRDQPARLMSMSKFHAHIGAENILPSLADAVVRARELTGGTPRTVAQLYQPVSRG